eukprot:8312087-Pyramimonas_sp.AAC.1
MGFLLRAKVRRARASMAVENRMAANGELLRRAKAKARAKARTTKAKAKAIPQRTGRKGI